MVDFQVVIPARFASTRLPRKALLPIAGKAMVVHVVEQAKRSGAQQVIVATDHQEIFKTVTNSGYDACMTSERHTSGTDRIAEVVEQQGWGDDSIIVNVQGDEPLMPPTLIRGVAEHLAAHPECAIATACHAIPEQISFRNPNIVKVALDSQQNALYFSRAPIPYPRDAFAAEHEMPAALPAYRHIGIYAYRARFLRAFGELKPAAIEQFEALEQLRALYYGYKIGVVIAEQAPATGVDTEQDLLQVQQLFSNKELA